MIAFTFLRYSLQIWGSKVSNNSLPYFSFSNFSPQANISQLSQSYRTLPSTHKRGYPLRSRNFIIPWWAIFLRLRSRRLAVVATPFRIPIKVIPPPPRCRAESPVQDRLLNNKADWVFTFIPSRSDVRSDKYYFMCMLEEMCSGHYWKFIGRRCCEIQGFRYENRQVVWKI